MRVQVRRSVAATAVTSLVAVVALFASASPASAAEDCVAGPSNHPHLRDWVCLYDHADFTGKFWDGPGTGGQGGSAKWIGAEFNDRVSAVINRSDRDLVLFQHVNWGGERVDIKPGEEWVAPPEWDNQVSGFYFY